MAEEARTYLPSFSWCKEIGDGYFAGGVGGIFAVFPSYPPGPVLNPGRPENAPWIWAVVGDVPPAYLPLSDASSPREVLETYINGMRRWVERVRNGDTQGTTAADVPPVNIPPTAEWAEKLKLRLDTLEQVVRPFLFGE